MYCIYVYTDCLYTQYFKYKVIEIKRITLFHNLFIGIITHNKFLFTCFRCLSDTICLEFEYLLCFRYLWPCRCNVKKVLFSVHLFRVQCVTCFGLTQMIVVAGESRPEGQDIRSAKISQRRSTTATGWRSSPELTNSSWKYVACDEWWQWIQNCYSSNVISFTHQTAYFLCC